MDARTYLTRCMPTRKQVDDFVNPAPGLPAEDNNSGWTFDSELGWVLKDSFRHDGVDRSRTYYHYEPSEARRHINFAGEPCRIHTYGNSFTHCDQVSDGETWQEYLAAHLQEPIGNYGVGGYGVYQAYLRMRRVESADPAEYVILNIWCDDHFRNLDAWRTIRFGQRTPCGFPLPHLRADLSSGRFSEMPNPTPSAEDVYKLLDADWVFATFAEDPMLACILAGQPAETAADVVPVTLGMPHAAMMGGEQADDGARQMARLALRSTQRVLEMTQEFLATQGSKLMVVLSHTSGVVGQALEHRPWWDQEFVDYLAGQSYPVIDLRDAHLADHACFNLPVGEYLQRFYIGHYAPAGNFFTALALKAPLVHWLDPGPKPYKGN